MDHRLSGDGRQLCKGPPLRARRKRGAKNQAIGLSRGGQTTKIHALSDTLGRPVALKVTAGNISDITMAEALLAEVNDCRYVLADKGMIPISCGIQSGQRAPSLSFPAENPANGKSASTETVTSSGGWWKRYSAA